MFADDFVEDIINSRRVAEEREKALKYTRKWIVTANLNKGGVFVCNEDKKDTVEVKQGDGGTRAVHRMAIYIP